MTTTEMLRDAEVFLARMELALLGFWALLLLGVVGLVLTVFVFSGKDDE